MKTQPGRTSILALCHRRGRNLVQILAYAVSYVGSLAFACASPSEFSWYSIGPRGDFGSSVQPPVVNGRVRSIQVLPIVGDYYVYIGAEGGGLWRARGSQGPVWQSLGENLPNPSVAALAVHPLVPEDIVVGTGDYNRFPGAGMFHTTDGGQTWSSISLPCAAGAIFRVYRLPGNLDTLVAATSCGLLRSTTGPNGPWVNVLPGLISDLVLHPSNPNIQFCAKATSGATIDGGIYRSGDGGQTWFLVLTTETPFENFGLARIAICRSQPNNMAFVYERGGVTRGVRKSVDGGANWLDITSTVELGQAFHCLAIAIRPNNPNEILVGANNIFRTVDGGQTWVYSDNIKPHQDQLQFEFSFVTGDHILWQCNDGGVYQINLDANSIHSWNGTGPSGLSIATVADMDARGAMRAIGLQDNGALFTAHGGLSWIGYTCCDVYSVAITDLPSRTFWYVDNAGGGPLVKQPEGAPAENVSDLGGPVTELLFEPFTGRVFGLRAQPNAMVSLVSRPALSATAPSLWRVDVANLPQGIGWMTANPLNGQSLYLWGGPPGQLTVVTRSGQNWSVARSSQIGQGSPISFAVASPDVAGEGWGSVTGDSQLRHTTDDWQNWTTLNPLPPSSGQLTGIAVTPANTRQIFVSTARGVFCTQDGGTTWQAFQTGLPPWVSCPRIQYLEAESSVSHDTLVLATYGRGVYERSLSRRGVVYVDQRYSGSEVGTRAQPYNSLSEGLTHTPNNGMMALNGALVYQAPPTLAKPMTITAYEFPVRLTR